MENLTCKGFKAAAVEAAVKKPGRPDLAMIVAEKPVTAAAVFTKNRVQAAPVLLSRKHIASGRCRAVIANSGNANCCTGSRGMADAEAMCRIAAQELGISDEMVCVASTGVIGRPMPIERITSKVPNLVENLTETGFEDFARAIMTTDQVPKIVRSRGEISGRPFTLLGVAKGSGMIRPDMATMLCFLCTDLQIPPEILSECLKTGTDRSFNRITVDGDTSTNDMVLIMAGGASDAAVETDDERKIFQRHLDEVMTDLAKMMVKDGEGATKFVEVTVRGAASEQDARCVADTIAHSSLVKTALFGEDANWGRIIAAAGRAGVPIDPDRVDIYFNAVKMAENGMGCGDAAEAEATEVLKTPEFAIAVDLKMGEHSASVFTCDFSVEYVHINADYRT